VQDEANAELIEFARKVQSMRSAQEGAIKNPLIEDRRKAALDHQTKVDRRVRQILKADGVLPFGKPQPQ